MLGAHSRPQGEKPVVRIRKRAPAADGDEAGIADAGKDHRVARVYVAARRTGRLRGWRLVGRAQRLKLRDGLVRSLTYSLPCPAVDAGGQYTYSDLAIETCLKLRLIYKLALRQTQGFVTSIFGLPGLTKVPVPHYSTLPRRHDGLSVDRCARKRRPQDEDAVSEDEQPTGEAPEARHVVIDSTGLKVYGMGEWKQRQHGQSKRRTWRKFHIGLDPETGEITATQLTDNSRDDASQVEALLTETLQHGAAIETVGGDGAYDK